LYTIEFGTTVCTPSLPNETLLVETVAVLATPLAVKAHKSLNLSSLWKEAVQQSGLQSLIQQFKESSELELCFL